MRRFYSTTTMTAMAQESAILWDSWRAHLEAPEDEEVARFVRNGMLFILPRFDEGVHATMKRMNDLGVDVEFVAREELQRRYPCLDTRSHWPVRSPGDDDFFDNTGLDDSGRQLEGAVFEKDAGVVISPLLATANLRAAAERRGARFLLGSGVVRIEKHGSSPRFRLTLEDGSPLEADILVNAAGPHSTRINRLAGVDLGIEIRPLRKESNVVANPEFSPDRGSSLPIVGDIDSGIYFRPETGGRDLLVGSLDPECDPQEWIDDPDTNSEHCTPRIHERHLMRLMKRFPEVLFEKRRGIASLYDVTLIDWNPVLDRTDQPGYYVAVGTSGSSFKTAPVIGTVMAELIEACEAGRDHDLDPVRIRLEHTGFELDVGFFSRRRGAHSSSNTVLG